MVMQRQSHLIAEQEKATNSAFRDAVHTFYQDVLPFQTATWFHGTDTNKIAQM